MDKDDLLPEPFRVRAITGGYTRDLATKSNLETGIGANVTGYMIPTAVQPDYGAHPGASASTFACVQTKLTGGLPTCFRDWRLPLVIIRRGGNKLAVPGYQMSSLPMLQIKYSARVVPTFFALCISLEPITPTSPGPSR